MSAFGWGRGGKPKIVPLHWFPEMLKEKRVSGVEMKMQKMEPLCDKRRGKSNSNDNKELVSISTHSIHPLCQYSLPPSPFLKIALVRK